METGPADRPSAGARHQEAAFPAAVRPRAVQAAEARPLLHTEDLRPAVHHHRVTPAEVHLRQPEAVRLRMTGALHTTEVHHTAEVRLLTTAEVHHRAAVTAEAVHIHPEVHRTAAEVRHQAADTAEEAVLPEVDTGDNSRRKF